MSRTLLLDLDGTLVDTVPDLAASLNRLMRARGLPDFNHQQVAGMVGDGVAKLVARAFAAHGREADAAAVTEMTEDYSAHVAIESKLYPNVLAVLNELASEGWRLAVCTNKPEHAARRLLVAMGLLDLMAAVGGGDSFPVRKPDPRHLVETLVRAGSGCDEAVMLGDHRNDVVSARGAGIPVIFAAWGYGTIGATDNCANVAHDMVEAAAIANRLLPEIATPG